MGTDRLRIDLLGPLEVSRGGRTVELPPSRKARALLGYLAARDRRHARASLCDLFWQDVADPRAGLRWALSKLRDVTDDEGSARIVAARGEVGLDPTEVHVDLRRVEAATSGEMDTLSATQLEAAASAFRGPFLEGLDVPGCHEYEAWSLGMRERLRALRVSILAELTTRLRDDPEAALPHALARLSVDPFTEAAYVSAMDVLAELGRADRGLELYERCQRMLSDHIGVRPSDELEAARRRLESPPRRRSPEGRATATEPTVPAEALADALARLPRPEGLPEIGPDEPPLSGRGAETEVLLDAVRHVASGEPGGVVLVTGEPGIGKSRLLRGMVREVRATGGWVVAGRMFETEEVRPYGPWADMLRGLPTALLDTASDGELPGLVPRRGSGTRAEGPTQRAQLFDAVSRLLGLMAGARGPGVVVIDDVQWLDASSAALLHYVIRRLGSTPMLVALAGREEEMGPGSPMGRLLRSLDDRTRLRRIPLERLGPAETRVLVHAVDPTLDSGPIYEISEGNPFFALAVASSLREGVSAIPSSIEEELGRRLDRLDPGALSILPWAAALGRTFDVPTLVRVVARPAHEIVDAVDELERRGVVRASGADRYDFTHTLLRQAAYRRPSEPARRAIHRSVAQALHASDRGTARMPGAVAYHAARGGLSRLAAGACIEAAEDCFWAFALDEAAGLVERGLGQLEALSGEERLPLEMGLLRIYTFRGMRERRPPDVEGRVRGVTDEAREAGLVHVIALGHALLMDLQYQRGAFREAGRSSVRSADAGRQADPRTAIRALSETAVCLLLLDQAPEDAGRLASEAFALAEEHDVEADTVALARALLHHREGNLDAARQAFAEVVRLGRRAKDRWWECPALARMILVELDRGDPCSALEVAREAEEAAERIDARVEAAFARGLGAVAEVRTRSADLDRSGFPNGAPGSAASSSDLRALDDALAELRELDSLWETAHVQAFAAELELSRGRLEEARARSEEVLAAARTLQRPSLLALARGLLARCATAQGRDREASRHLDAPEVTRPGHHVSYRARRAVERARQAGSG